MWAGDECEKWVLVWREDEKRGMGSMMYFNPFLCRL